MALLTSSGLTSAPSSSVQTDIGAAGAPSAANVIAKGNALVNNPAPAYTGQLTAGTSGLQQEAWNGLSNLTLPSALVNAGNGLQDIASAQAGSRYTGPTETNQYSATGAYNPANIQANDFDYAAAQQYMNPYLQASLNPQLEEARRQALITQQGNAAKATSQGAFGGSRAALMESENQRNLGTNLANITGQGYNTAYNNAMNQFNADQGRNMTAQQQNEASRQYAQNQALANAQNTAQYGQAAQAANLQNAQFGANYGLQALQNAATSEQAAANAGAQQAQYGLQNLQALSTAGNTQQAQNQAGLNALYNQYIDQRNQNWTNLANQANIVKSLGGSAANTYGASPSDMQKITGVASGAAELMKNLKDAGMAPDAISKALNAIGINPNTLIGNKAKVDESGGLPPGVYSDGSGGYVDYMNEPVDKDGNPI